jgi:5-deoxy-glucuronate isomerase
VSRRRVDHVRRGTAREGFTPVLGPENAPLRDLAVGRLRLDARRGAHGGDTGERETVLHVLVGACTIEAEGRFGRRTLTGVGGRRDVFGGLPTTVVLAPGTRFAVTAATPTADLAVASVRVRGGAGGAPAVVRPEDVRVHEIGEGHWAREVREVLGGDGPARRLRAGETVNRTGCWSSWPHHDFDADPALAPAFEEVFLYFTKPRGGWALQRRQGLFATRAPVDDVLVVGNGDAAVLPLGDHPIVAGVDSAVLYVWFYVSPIPKVYARWAEDLGGYA